MLRMGTAVRPAETMTIEARLHFQCATGVCGLPGMLASAVAFLMRDQSAQCYLVQFWMCELE
jgi:hypothetical protein